jgi:hypothetical protein
MRIAKHGWNITNALTLAVFAEPHTRRAALLLCPTYRHNLLKSSHRQLLALSSIGECNAILIKGGMLP